MQSLNESLSLFLKAVQKKSGGGIQTNITRPELTHSFNLEKEHLLTKEVVMGVPQLKVNFLPSCNYGGCNASHSHIHVRERVEFIDDLQRYNPVMIKDEAGEEIEDISKRPLGLRVEDDGLWMPVQHRYVYSEPCPFCGRTNQYLIRFKQSGLTAAAIDKHLGNYEWEDGLEDLAKGFAEKRIQGGLIHGHTGNGKTHLLAALAREMIWRGKRVRYVSHQNLLERIKQSFDDKSDIKDPRYIGWIKWTLSSLMNWDSFE